MTRKNIKIPEPLFNALRDDKDDAQSWPHYLETECLHDGNNVQEQLDDIQRTVEQNNGALGDTVEKALNIGEHGFTDIVDRLDRIESAAETAEERTGTIERKVDDLGGGR